MAPDEKEFDTPVLQHCRDNHNKGCSIDQMSANYSLWAKSGFHLCLQMKFYLNRVILIYVLSMLFTIVENLWQKLFNLQRIKYIIWPFTEKVG